MRYLKISVVVLLLYIISYVGVRLAHVLVHFHSDWAGHSVEMSREWGLATIRNDPIMMDYYDWDSLVREVSNRKGKWIMIIYFPARWAEVGCWKVKDQGRG